MSRDDKFSDFHFKNEKTKRNENFCLQKKFDRLILSLNFNRNNYTRCIIYKRFRFHSRFKNPNKRCITIEIKRIFRNTMFLYIRVHFEGGVKSVFQD